MELNKIKKVLIAIDYDETAQKVAETGYTMAKAMNAEPILLHVIFEQPIYYSESPYILDLHVEIIDDLKKSVQNFLNKTKDLLGDKSIQTILKEGEIGQTILDTAKEMNVDVIVMGSHGRKWLENILMGSQSKAVLGKTTIPLFIVPTKKQS